MRDRDGDDHQVFLEATLPHVDALYRIARHLADDAASAEDLVQETYLRAYAHFGQHRGGSTRAWLASICLNIARSGGRRQRSRPVEVLAERAGELPQAVRGVAETAINGLQRQQIELALARLPEPQRRCVLLMDVAGYTARETATVLGCARGTVLARVHRGRRRLAGYLTGTCADQGAGHGQA